MRKTWALVMAAAMAAASLTACSSSKPAETAAPETEAEAAETEETEAEAEAAGGSKRFCLKYETSAVYFYQLTLTPNLHADRGRCIMGNFQLCTNGSLTVV